ncbi:hypothetical protein ES707_22098 [subsurface metagenome]
MADAVHHFSVVDRRELLSVAADESRRATDRLKKGVSVVWVASCADVTHKANEAAK